MGVLLHMSDLHLTGPDDDTDVLGDYKLDAVPHAERQRRTKAIRSTLEQLGGSLTEAKIKLDAIVITGDVTVRGRQEGIDVLPGVLNQLGDALPTPDRILIVPGNHDVVWGTPPSSADRYAQFVKLRDHGYRTAYLDGVDADSDGTLRATPWPLDPCVVGADNSFVVIGINSCDMCGVEAIAEPDVLGNLAEIERLTRGSDPTADAVKSLYTAWKRRGLHDVARVSDMQRKLCNLLAVRERKKIVDEGKPAPVMIAAFHHQLRPVSAVEEFKPFEGITNLGEVRDWLAGNQFDVLLHGHKHEENVLEDLFVPFAAGNLAPSHRLLVVSAPTIGHGQPASSPVARLITVDADMPRIVDIALKLIPPRSAGLPLPLKTLPTETYTVGNDDGARVGVLEAVTAEHVYNKILANRAKLDTLPRPLICRFQDGPSALNIPANYPDIGFAAEGVTTDALREKMQQWFKETVAWWERPTRGTAAPFNHGERIRSRRGADPSQFESAIESLRSNHTGRAIMLLIEPAIDFNDGNRFFPAFALVQMLERDGALTMTGYFRKQEMPHWWPINAAELATLQQDAIAELRARGTNLAAGSICTITALPVAGSSAPRVVVPDIDRRVETPAAFLELVVPLFFGGASPEEMKARWSLVIDDWRPTDQIAADGDPVPVLGFAQLADLAKACLALSSGCNANDKLGRRLISELGWLRDANARYAGEQRGAERVHRHQQWRHSVDGLIEQILTTVEEMAQSVAAGG
jgi:3',5'-cyclic AMP phosphodiesterase CpdA